MSAFRKVVAYALGQNPDAQHAAAQLQAASVPVSDDACRGCADPCDEGHDEYPKFDVDMETEMLGSVKPYGRQVVISSGKTDWVREVTDARGTLAAHLSSVSSHGHFSPKKEKDRSKSDAKPATNGASVSGVFATDLSKVKKVSILNGSHRAISEDDDKETVLVFPDYTVIAEVPNTHAGAEALWEHSLSPAVDIHAPPELSNSSVKTWILPYACVILLCSHKRRDNRCAIAAPKLEHALTLALEREGWEVHTQVEDPSAHGAPALEDDPALAAVAAAAPPKDPAANGHADADASVNGGANGHADADADAQRRAAIAARLQADAADSKRALVLYCSHIGGHKYAGNVIINTPQGASIWYGRVTPHEVDAIVRETILGGRVLPALLRGGMNLARPGNKTLNDW